MVIFLVPLLIYSQGIGIGIKAGANFADPSVTGTSIKTVTDYHLGGYLNLNLTKKWGITPEVLYTANGSKWADIKVDLDYVAIPVMLRYKPIDLLSLEVGPQFSLLTRAHMDNFGDIKDQLKTNDFGLAFGAGLHLPLGLNAGARYVLGFTNISNVSTADNSIKNRTFQIYVGWTFIGAK